MITTNTPSHVLAVRARQLIEELNFITAGLAEPGEDAGGVITLVDTRELAKREAWVTSLRKAAEVAEGRLAVLRGQMVYTDYFPKDRVTR